MGVNEYADMTLAEFKASKLGRSKAIASQNHTLTTEEGKGEKCTSVQLDLLEREGM